MFLCRHTKSLSLVTSLFNIQRSPSTRRRHKITTKAFVDGMDTRQDVTREKLQNLILMALSGSLQFLRMTSSAGKDNCEIVRPQDKLSKIYELTT